MKKLNTFFILWSTQSLSQLGSAMTGFALTLWLYETTGSALKTALLSVFTYAPYVVVSIFAGALSDKWDKKKILLSCDTFAALCTVAILILFKTGRLLPLHMYILNAMSGLMNTVQQPAGDVLMTLVTPKEYYQKTSGLRSFSQSLVTVLHPVLATAIFAAFGMEAVIFTDLLTFAAAFLSLAFFIHVPKSEIKSNANEPFNKAVRSGLLYLKENRLILVLILFLAGVNFVASAFDAALPPFVLSNTNGNETVLGIVTSCAGAATLVGSLIVTILPPPKDRVRVIYITMLFSLGTENFILAFCKTPLFWCAAQVIGWILVPVMSANLDVILRSTIPVNMQGRVYSCRNTLQFFTIPIGFLAGGSMVDATEAFMSGKGGLLAALFGSAKGSGAALTMFILGIAGVVMCLSFGKVLKKYHY